MKEKKIDVMLVVVFIFTIALLPWIIALHTTFMGALVLWALFDMYIILIAIRVGLYDG